MELTEENKLKIRKAINSYFSLCFYALFHDLPIIFHGDPHAGNIYIDKKGNIGFFDMGLIFELSKENAFQIRELFLTAYMGKEEELLKLLLPYGVFDEKKKTQFMKEIKEYCEKVPSLPIPAIFMEVVFICLRYQIEPPEYLFCMTKSFVCLNGIQTITDNLIEAREILKEQTIEFYVRTLLKDSTNILKDGIKIIPRFLNNLLKNGSSSSISKEFVEFSSMEQELRTAFQHYEDLSNLMKINFHK